MLGQKATKVGRQATAVQGDLTVFNKGQYDESGIGNGPFDDITAIVDPATNLLITPAQDGTDATGVVPPAGAVGIRGWLSGIFSVLSARLPTLNSGRVPVEIDFDGEASLAKDGTEITGVVMPAGGASTRGWLSAIWKALSGGLPNAPQAKQTGPLVNLNDAVTVSCDGFNTAVVQLAAGAWVGTVVFEASADGGTTWNAVSMVPYAGGPSAALAPSAAAGGLWEMNCGGLTNLRARASGAITSGPVAAIVTASNGMKSVRIGAPAGNPVPVAPLATAFADRSGSTSATVSTWTAPFAANPARQYARITNTSTAVIYVWDKTGAPSQAGAIPLQPTQAWVWDAKVPNTAIQVMSATASMPFEACEG